MIKRSREWLRLMFVALFCVCALGQLKAEEIRVAVASNFNGAMKELAERFEAETDYEVTLIPGSTGKHYAQIIHGAPFDVFFAADRERPELLEQGGLIVPGSRFTYAIGKLVLWSPKAGLVDQEGDVLNEDRFRFLAIANPKLAPYGKAAQEVLEKRGLWGKLNERIVRGENIAQTFQFVKTGNADLGFVAYAQMKFPSQLEQGTFWVVPQEDYSPIEQQAVLLKERQSTHAFLSYIRSKEALKIINEYGYDTP
ncbi:molybdate ABC transporter substrate-binding protein [Rubellicoccus peritrichatus]|uniref:Molybdate ABC transporter substrate-binding protein n=1 Tax=Rubellicoccus peritrichatus TaxID=3080537 RepID=A0AAQ3QUH0_9BACT|nr:molybdate ABC transporter substrate-binding protein [Puniceicoccus sp. CR14]WOO39707.1 molybdate ABC transporter substrate-binding protein [Puniceicoccus sp. CR14]